MAWAHKQQLSVSDTKKTVPSTGESIRIFSTDGEEFECSRQLLRFIKSFDPKESSFTVDCSDCLTLDWVLRFLEAQQQGTESGEDVHFDLDVASLSEYLAIARKLQIPTLEKYCLTTKAKFENVKQYTWEEVLKHQKADDCWIVIDERVYDVTKWLPIHPGGKALLLGLGKDSTYLFEIYHATNEAYKLLNNYFLGVLAAGEAKKMPKPPPKKDSASTEPSDAFLSTLRSLTFGHANNAKPS